MQEPGIVCENLVKIYQTGPLEVIALQGIDLRIVAGEMVALVGVSGSGKSTLLTILGGADTPTAGICRVAGFDLTRMDIAQRTRYRRDVIGYLWQQSSRNLIAEYTILQNVSLPMEAAQVRAEALEPWAMELLDLVGLAGKARRYPQQLSGGEQQRAGMAVALANRPRILLADEPTGELDSATAEEILALLRAFNQRFGLTVVAVTHDAALAAGMQRIIAIRDGRISTEAVRRTAAVPVSNQHNYTTNAIIGLSGVTHREVVMVDRVGRLQIPQALADAVRLGDRVEIRQVEAHLELWPITESEAS